MTIGTKDWSLRIGASVAALSLAFVGAGYRPAAAAQTTYDITTLKGKVASVNGTQGLGIRMSAFIEQESGLDDDPNAPLAPDGATLADPADGGSVKAPDITVNQDTNGAPQNETSIAVDPNNPQHVVGSANDYVSRTWGNNLSGQGDGYSGTYYSTNGGTTWCCNATDPSHLGSLIPGVTRLTGGQYDAGGDPAVAFDSRGNVYYAGLGFNRDSAPNTVAVNKGTFSGSTLTWSAPTFINQTTSPSVFNDKEWIAADHYASSPFRDRVYVTWTRFIFNPVNGNYVQSPISFVYSTDGGKTFSSPQLISGNVLYGQGSRPVVGPDGNLYVFWNGSTRHDALNSTYVVKSTDGGVTWSKPVAVGTTVNIINPANTAFRVNSFPAAAAASNGTLYTTWTTEANNTTGDLADPNCAYWIAGAAAVRANCHSVAVYSTSTDGGSTWSTPQPAFAAGTRTAVGYTGSSLSAPAARPIEDVYPSVAANGGKVYIGAYRGDVVSPWQSCAAYNATGSVACDTPGAYVNNTKLDYVVRSLTTDTTRTMTALPINTRYQFRGQFIGDYTEISAAPDGTVHALWTDTNNVQTITNWYGGIFNPSIRANEQDVVTNTGNF